MSQENVEIVRDDGLGFSRGRPATKVCDTTTRDLHWDLAHNRSGRLVMNLPPLACVIGATNPCVITLADGGVGLGEPNLEQSRSRIIVDEGDQIVS